MTRTFKLTPHTSRDSRLARAASRAKGEARTLYLAAREARAIYALEARELHRQALARDMSRATLRDYVNAADDRDATYDWRIR